MKLKHGKNHEIESPTKRLFAFVTLEVTKKRFVYNQDKVCPKESFTIENGRKCDAYLFVI